MDEKNCGLVSILIPAYNVEKYVGQCLNSVLNQTYNNLEVILVNDGSTDGTINVLTEFAKKDSRIKLFDIKNDGVANARNFALSKATGDYILFIDSDDWVEIDMVESLVNCLIKNPHCDMAFCKMDCVNKYEQPKQNNDSDKIEIWDRDKQVYEFLRHRKLNGSLVVKLIKSEICKDLIFDRTVGYGEDAQWFFKVINRSNGMVTIDKTFYHYVMQEGSISHQTYSSKKFSSIKVWKEIEAYINEKYPKYKKIVKERLLCSSTYLLYEMKKSRVKNKVENKALRKTVRQNIGIIFCKNEISFKMKIYALKLALGF